ncbi:MAG: hypothetical protein M1399_08735, partial [Actinobacteria bacterium]|nr:hypothetical protein [Actinomycetota bacterium]
AGKPNWDLLPAVMPRQDGDLPNIAAPGIVSTRAESCFATFVRNCPPDSHGHENGITPPDGSSLSGLWASTSEHPTGTILPCCWPPSIPACGHLNPFISEDPQFCMAIDTTHSSNSLPTRSMYNIAFAYVPSRLSPSSELTY